MILTNYVLMTTTNCKDTEMYMSLLRKVLRCLTLLIIVSTNRR